MLGAIIGDLAGTKYEYREFLNSRKGIINVERRKENGDVEYSNVKEKDLLGGT